MMRRRQWFLMAAGAVAILAGGAVVHASDPVGVYARIDKVVMEPDERAPQRIQVWGVFAIADPRNGSDYLPARGGYLYFSAPADPTLALREWADLKSVTGTSQIVAFGSRWNPLPKLRAAGDPPASPDSYGINVGVVKISGRTDYAPVRSVREFTR